MNQNITSESPNYGIITILMIGAFISFLNNTLLNIALPSIMNEFTIGPATVQWLTTGFMLVNGIMIPTTAFLIQKYSVRHLFIFAMGIFSVGTILSGYAPIFPLLITGRMLQACGSAVMMPLLMNVMLVSFPIEKRGRVMGVFGLIMMAAPAIGPTLSGWIVEHYNWRMLFHFVTPIAIIIFLLGIFLLKDKKEKNDLKLDFTFLILSTTGFGGLLYGFSSAGSMSWSHPLVYGTIIIGIVSLVIFIIRQSRLERPMLNFTIFKYPMFALSAAITMVLNMAMFSGMLLLPIYVQNLRGISPFDAGIMLLPGAIVLAIMSPVTGRLFDQYGGKVLAIVGLSITTITTYILSTLSLETTYFFLMGLHAVRMFGISMVMMPISTNGLNQLPARFYPHGTAMNNTLNQVSGAIGTAILVTIMSNRAESSATSLITNGTFQGMSQAEIEQNIYLYSTLDGINFAFFVSTFFAAFALLLAFFIKRATQAPDPLDIGAKN